MHDPKHNLFNSENLDQTHLILAFFLINILLVIYGLLLNIKDNLKYSENLGSFWTNIRGIEQKIWYTNEVY